MFGHDIRSYDLKVELAKCFNGCGTVFLAQHLPSQQHVAVKKFLMEDLKNDFNLIMEESKHLREFNHPNILSYHTAFVHNADLYFILPLMCFGSCRDTMSNYFETGFPEIILACIIRDVVAGLEYLHRKGYIHRSIRASHIFLNESRAIIGGFRVCTSFLGEGKRVKNLHELPPHSTKSLNWLAPEVLAQNLLGYTEKSDIYSLGITACELANGVEPFSNFLTTLMLTEKMRGYQPLLLDNSTIPSEEVFAQAMDSGVGDTNSSQTRQIYASRQFTDSLHKFAELCLQFNPNDRPSAAELINHSMFKQCKHTGIREQFAECGIETADFNTIKDFDLNLSNDFASMSMDTGSFEWDFAES
ncbi:STE20-related kinase adapter protein alpha [Uranotaenia lowii]|uniref:STE20-related kinase adapter protein alpha n=1 Tax=Uranotaenia lowii TaxID=190385 RepID=UPI002479C410|nr:STE20-related kinase adapter protein alpha [Uranotaenia lowii]XP_055592812.1 STE20-related kinase adapter protein alpha [Uranotaenia lowii]